MAKRWKVRVAFGLLLVTACGGPEEEAVEEVSLEAPTEAPTEAAPSAAPDRAPLAEAPEAPEAEGPAEEATDTAPEADDEALAAFEATLGEARAAAETYETGSTLCEAAHASLAAMMEAVAERYPDQVAPVPPKGAFVQACQRLPEEAQQCLLPTYVMSHQEECRTIADGLDPDQRAYLEQVLGGG